MVIWIIGKSGVGKSYFAKKIFDKLKLKIKKIIWVDGDKFRKKFSNDLGYSIKDRRLNSSRLQKHCLNYDKKKYLVPNDLTVAQFIYVIRKRLNLHSEKAMFIFINGQLPTNSHLINDLYEINKDQDGFLYVTYALENTFG